MQNQTTSFDSLTPIIRRRRDAALDREEGLALLGRILAVVLVAYVLFTQVFSFTQVTGNAMFPALKDGDLALTFLLQKNYSKGDVVLYEQDGKLVIGRIAANCTDVVTLDDTGTMLVNGTVQGGEIMYPTYAKEGFEYPLRLPDDAVFILGDYRTQSTDSRDFGPVPVKNIQGKVITILRRRGL